LLHPDWVAANARRPAVVTLSLGIAVGGWSRVLEDAVRGLVERFGLTVVVAAGNSNVDACYVAPANVPEAITVAALGRGNASAGGAGREPAYRYGNSGPCVDLLAPGVDIYSACGSPGRCAAVGDRAYAFASGTSMAVPHVAGVAAAYLEAHPEAAPAEVAAALLAAAAGGAVDAAGLKPGTANRVLQSRLEPGAVEAADGQRGGAGRRRGA
jgi:subtilisin family serine protease